METTNPNPPSGAKRRRLTESERREHLSAWKRSGRSARDYASEHGLRAANLYAWSKKERSGGRERVTDSSFVPVRIAPGTIFGAEPRVTLKARDLEYVIEGAGSPEAFAALAAALKREVLDV
ncbi:MAG TPA: transposase [Opitutales bacterium]|nr:transposase [Opitutales bacterium]